MSAACNVGTGNVGLSVGACFADVVRDVACLDIGEAKIVGLRAERSDPGRLQPQRVSAS